MYSQHPGNCQVGVGALCKSSAQEAEMGSQRKLASSSICMNEPWVQVRNHVSMDKIEHDHQGRI